MNSLKDYILVIDDDLNISTFIEKALTARGHVAKIAQSGEHIFTILGESPPKIVLLDINLPWIQGDKICKIIKKNHPEIKVIIMSGREFDDIRKKSEDNGADAFFQKPFNIHELFYIVEQFTDPKPTKEKDDSHIRRF